MLNQPRRGSIIAITGANPLSVIFGTYENPLDGLNLAGPWYKPVNPKGRATHRLASLVYQAVELAEYVVDMHGNPLPSIPFVLTGVSLARDTGTNERTEPSQDLSGSHTSTGLRSPPRT